MSVRFLSVLLLGWVSADVFGPSAAMAQPTPTVQQREPAPRLSDRFGRSSRDRLVLGPDGSMYDTGLAITALGGAGVVASVPVFFFAGVNALDGNEGPPSPTTLAYIGLGSLCGGVTLAAAGTVVSGFGLRRRGGWFPVFGLLGTLGFLVADAGVVYAVLNPREDFMVELFVIYMGAMAGGAFTLTQLFVNKYKNKTLPAETSRNPWGIAPLPMRDGIGLQLVVGL